MPGLRLQVVLCTLLSAPIMFIMAKLALLPNEEEEVRRSASNAAELMGTASTFFCLVTMALFMINRRLKHRLDRAVYGNFRHPSTLFSLFSTISYAISAISQLQFRGLHRVFRSS